MLHYRRHWRKWRTQHTSISRSCSQMKMVEKMWSSNMLMDLVSIENFVSDQDLMLTTTAKSLSSDLCRNFRKSNLESWDKWTCPSSQTYSISWISISHMPIWLAYNYALPQQIHAEEKNNQLSRPNQWIVGKSRPTKRGTKSVYGTTFEGIALGI